nr:hypothetical protein [Tanacetum cinerariifolium]
MGADWLRVFVAYDIRYNGNAESRKGNVRMQSRGNGFVEIREGNVRMETRGNNSYNRRGFAGEGNTNSLDNRRFADVVNSGNNKDGVDKLEKTLNGMGVQPNNN